jgi:2-C-methyl-D-erythritol 2,4-cyclodiphosphate synthase
MTDFRVGQGFDVHRFGGDGDLILCGVAIPDEVGLEGHSDGDVALHSVADAILGAVARGDVGEHFPPSEERWRGADSGELVKRVLAVASGEGFRVVNCDLTLVGEQPLIAPYRERLRSSLAHILNVDESVVSVKATTTEGLGFTGRKEGLAAMTVVLMERRSDDD